MLAQLWSGNDTGGFAANWSQLPRFKRQSPGRKHPARQRATAVGCRTALALLLADPFFWCARGCLNLRKKNIVIIWGKSKSKKKPKSFAKTSLDHNLVLSEGRRIRDEFRVRLD